ncbi:uncharacterized protein [Venturia canescens]|uniref:uncharacterized protein n=1 Tax=Venturia canescens TaxID=32260 RepID=UPI001C9CF3EF|nr:uncharacterized protein LOC122413417 [Venturia canescens]XP_043279675.1 uncharacterized protein LOC122413417 [Venturia canescens]XP_043279676.1 uncharacterized protein LOC122413417 [Venturia canescens]XP_043279677.1 uncharacterized protein LOC122413417 [Venturia canescens]
MLQRGNKTVTSSDVGSANVLDPQHNHQLHRDSSRFNEWIDPTSDGTDAEVSHLVNEPVKKQTNQKTCCRISTSSGYSSQSPPLSAGSCYPGCCPNPGIAKNTSTVPSQNQHQRHHHHHHQHPSGNARASSAAVSQNQQQQSQPPTVNGTNLAVIHEAETIPRPIWPYMGDDFGDIRGTVDPSSRCEMLDCEIAGAPTENREATCKHENIYSCCDYCRACGPNAYSDSCVNNGTASSAREVLLELSRTLNSVIEAENHLTAEEILRDISITVARSINNQPKEDPALSSVACEDYIYRLSSSSSSGAGKESLVGVNPVNLRVYGKPKWLHVPVSSRSSSQCPYEVKNLLTATQKASRTTPAHGGKSTSTPGIRNPLGNAVTPEVFLVPHANSVYSNIPHVYRANQPKIGECKATRSQNISPGQFNSGCKGITSPIGRLNGRPNDNCGDKCPPGEPVYSTLDGSDESSSYGAIGDSSAKNVWPESSKVFDPHLDFTLDGHRAERLGRAIAKAKRKRQWCRGLTAMFGLVFFVLSVVVVSLSVTKGRKVFGSM